ncbi:MAG: LysR substrate-binding domain-containing protein, partial [Pseudomonadota bacterium]|nr:LysR substrate-binding domain-containing protein [Pseudomonadota bacterium]
RVPVSPRVRCNAAETEKMLALLGVGITRLPELACREELAQGRLVSLLQDYQRPPSGVHVLYPSKENMPSKTRAMIDFLVEKSRQR